MGKLNDILKNALAKKNGDNNRVGKKANNNVVAPSSKIVRNSMGSSKPTRRASGRGS